MSRRPWLVLIGLTVGSSAVADDRYLPSLKLRPGVPVGGGRVASATAGPTPGPTPGPVVPFPPARATAWVTLVYDAGRVTSGVAALRDSPDPPGARWRAVDKQARLADGRFAYQVLGFDRALVDVGLPALVAQAADGTVLRARRVPQGAAAARAMRSAFLAVPPGGAEVHP